jgi:hypothetical protein
MCGCYRLSRKKQIVDEYFASVSGEQEWSPRYNVAPPQSVPVIRQNPREPVRELLLIRWGLIPSAPAASCVFQSLLSEHALPFSSNRFRGEPLCKSPASCSWSLVSTLSISQSLTVRRLMFRNPVKRLQRLQRGPIKKGGVMQENKKKWMELCEQAADEQDPKKLAALILRSTSSSKPRSCD